MIFLNVILIPYVAGDNTPVRMLDVTGILVVDELLERQCES